MIALNISTPPLWRSFHNKATPTAGGIAFIASFYVTLMIALHSPFLLEPRNIFQSFVTPPPLLGHIALYFVASFILAVVSFKDDCTPLSYRVRLSAQLICVLFLIQRGMVIQFPAFEPSPWIAMAVTTFTLIALINSTNFIDGLNGLLAGSYLIAIIFAFFIIISPKGQVPSLALFVLYGTLFASVFGFLIFNFPKAQIFMGDVGSTFLGLSLGFLALIAQDYYSFPTDTAFVNKGFIFTLTPMSFLWFDVGSTLIRRIFGRKKLTEAHRDHMFHILHDSGYSHTAVSSLYFCSVIIMGTLTLLTHWGHLSFMEFFLVYGVLQAGFCAWVMPARPKLV
ncbi:MAG: hypothetical protein NTX76_05855 [Alphaproteobacteria bacterium]|nr:hypothetical protein [Alphaproteobacteria bacterium]